MGKDEYFQSFRVNADNFMCTLLPGISNHPQIQYSPGPLASQSSNMYRDSNSNSTAIDLTVNNE